LEIGDEPGKLTGRLERITTEFSELLKRYKSVLEAAISIISEYRAEVFPALEKAVESISLEEQVEAFKSSGRISAVSETKDVGIPLAICSTSYCDGNDKLFNTVRKIYEEFESKGKPFNYFFFPDREGSVDVSERFTRIIQSLFVDKVRRSSKKGAIIISLKTLPTLPSGESRIFVDKNFRRDPRNILEKVKNSLDRNFGVQEEGEVFGGGSLAYCLKVMAESQDADVSVLDLTITRDIVEADKIRELIQVFCEIAEKEFS